MKIYHGILIEWYPLLQLYYQYLNQLLEYEDPDPTFRRDGSERIDFDHCKLLWLINESPQGYLRILFFENF